MKIDFDIEKDLSSQLGHIKQCCTKFLYDQEERDLLYSEVLEKIWTKKHLFSGTEDEFRAWSFTITRNSFISKYNHKKKYRIEDIDEVYDQPRNDFDVTEDMDNKKQLTDIFYTIEKRFKKDHVSIFKANVVEGKKYEECVEEFGYPMGTVKNVIHTIRQYISDPLNIVSENRVVVFRKTREQNLIVPDTKLMKLLMKIGIQYSKQIAA